MSRSSVVDHGVPEKSGLMPDVAAAKLRLEEAFRAWAAWAGIRPEGTEAPRWSQASDCGWLISGGYHLGRVLRPIAGPRHDPHWRLLVLTAAQPAPFDQAGWAATDEEARAALLDAWGAFLTWAELPGIGGPG